QSLYWSSSLCHRDLPGARRFVEPMEIRDQRGQSAPADRVLKGRRMRRDDADSVYEHVDDVPVLSFDEDIVDRSRGLTALVKYLGADHFDAAVPVEDLGFLEMHFLAAVLQQHQAVGAHQKLAKLEHELLPLTRVGRLPGSASYCEPRHRLEIEIGRDVLSD